MEKLKKGYYYFFYKFYKFSEAAPSKWMSDWKAVLIINALEIFTCFSILFYYTALTGKSIPIDNGSFLIILYIVFIMFPNYLIFHYKNQWKRYVKEFDKLPKEKNKIGGLIVWSIVVLIIANFITLD